MVSSQKSLNIEGGRTRGQSYVKGEKMGHSSPTPKKREGARSLAMPAASGVYKRQDSFSTRELPEEAES